LVLLANYDTELNAPNPLEENGSGVVLLVSIAEQLAHLLAQDKLALAHSVVIAFTDLAQGKYKQELPVRAMTGAEALIQRWLGRYMENRRKFRGAIVLDSVANFRDEDDTQDAYQLRSSFPSAYEIISENRLRGDFLAVVSRVEYGDDVKLATSFETAWNATSSRMGKLVQIDFTNDSISSNMLAPRYFLRSEQTAFWNPEGPQGSHRLRTKQLPAILLTDTARYRRSSCSTSTRQCSVTDVATEKNLRFMAQTGNALVRTVQVMQKDDDANSGVSAVYATVVPMLLTVAFHKLFSF